MIKKIISQSWLLFLPVFGYSQAIPKPQAMLKPQANHTIRISYDLTLLNHPLLFSRGFQVRYQPAFLTRNHHQLVALGTFGWVSTPGVDNRFLFGLGTGYKIDFLTHFYATAGLHVHCVMSVLAYDRYAYTSDGTWKNQGNRRHTFGPGISFSTGGTFLRKATFQAGTFLEIRMTRLNESYAKKWREGYVPTVSLGIETHF